MKELTFNKLYIDNRYAYYKNSDKYNNFILSDRDHPNYNNDEYLVCQELYNLPTLNSWYYYNYIYKSLADNSLSITRARIFQTIQKFNLGFSKLILLIKHRYKLTKNQHNVLLDNFKTDNIKIIHNDNLYMFDYFEIYKISKESFYFNSQKQCNKIIIKNPYTNEIFNYHILVQIYFHLLNHGKIPEMFFLFFKSNFSSDILKDNYLINLYINNFKNDFIHLSEFVKLSFISAMLKSSEYFVNFDNLDDEIKMTLFEKIAAYYYIELQIESFFFEGYESVTNKLHKKYTNYLHKLKQNNPQLGRKIIKNSTLLINSNYTI